MFQLIVDNNVLVSLWKLCIGITIYIFLIQLFCYNTYVPYQTYINETKLFLGMAQLRSACLTILLYVFGICITFST